MDLNYALALVSTNGNRIALVPNPTLGIRKAAIKRTPSAIAYISDPTLYEQELAILTQGKNDRFGLLELLELIPTIDKTVVETTIHHYGCCIKLIGNPTYEQKKIAVNTDGDAIQYIKNPEEELQLLAIRDQVAYIILVDNPAYAVVEHIVKNNPTNISYIKHPHIDHQRYVLDAIPEDGLLYIENIDEDLAFEFITNNPDKIGMLHNQTEECCWAALHIDGSLIKHIRNPDQSMKSYAVLVSNG